jgi:hypothetical protein
MTNAAALTYDSLTSLVLQYLERTDPAVVAFIPQAIMLAEFEIAQNIKTLGQMAVMYSFMNSGAVIPKPARWRKTVSMTVSTDLLSNQDRQPVLLRKLEYLNYYSPDSNVSGVPLYYADYDAEHWLVAPPPNAQYYFEVLYYARLEPLSSQNQTNWLTQNAPNAMIYGTLKQTAPFLKDDARLAVWSGLFDAALLALKTEDQLRVGDRQSIVQDS